MWLYWRAYNFFKQFNLHLQLQVNSVYMSLGENDHWETNPYYYYSNDDNNYCPNSILQKYKTAVRCGELEVYRTYSELNYQAGCIWVFPFDEDARYEDSCNSHKKVKAYLLQFNHDAMVALDRRIVFPMVYDDV